MTTDDHTCGLDEHGAARCWGADALGQSAPPPGPFKAISVTSGWGCGIQADDTLSCWGLFPYWGEPPINEPLPPPPEGRFVSVSVGGTQACALTAAGEARCWGHVDANGQLPATPPGPFASIAASRSSICGVTTAGDVICWGSDASIHPAER